MFNVYDRFNHMIMENTEVQLSSTITKYNYQVPCGPLGPAGPRGPAAWILPIGPDAALITVLTAAVELDVGLGVGITDDFAEIFAARPLSTCSLSISTMPGNGGARGGMAGGSKGVTVPFGGSNGALGDFGCPAGLTVTLADGLVVLAEVFAAASRPMLLSSTSPTVLISAPDLRQRPAEPPQDCCS